MDYFMGSIFSDPTSNNAVLRMQYMHTGMPLLDEEERLKGMTGIEFSIVEAAEPHLFVIHKRRRDSPTEAQTLAAYYIMNNAIYCAPDIYTILSTRLQTSVQQLRSGLDIIRKHRPDFTPRAGYAWDVVQSSQEKARPPTRAQSVVPGEEGGEGPEPTIPEDTRKTSSKLGGGNSTSVVPSKNQFSALQRAMGTTFKYIEERSQKSLIPIITDEEIAQPSIEAVDTSAPSAGSVAASTVPPGTTATPGTSLERAQTSTVGGSSAGYTPAGVGAATSPTAARSVSAAVPGTPAAKAASPGGPSGGGGVPGPPGLPGQGKKKKKRLATGILKAALSGAVSPSNGAASPQSPTSPT
ncbi:Mediator of RNA polymerase II transcription subunit 6 [Tulasnella sp. 427]|nr:Mediator of RNA polymerase II transcription subunit 6 [Tulasnella sp. 427]